MKDGVKLISDSTGGGDKPMAVEGARLKLPRRTLRTIIGNIVYDNPGGGILNMVGVLQGAHGIDRSTHPTVTKNVVYRNGKLRPAIGSSGAGSIQAPVRFERGPTICAAWQDHRRSGNLGTFSTKGGQPWV